MTTSTVPQFANSPRHFVFTRVEEVQSLSSATDKLGRGLQLAEQSMKPKLARQRLKLDEWFVHSARSLTLPRQVFLRRRFAVPDDSTRNGFDSRSASEVTHV